MDQLFRTMPMYAASWLCLIAILDVVGVLLVWEGPDTGSNRK